MEGVYQLSKREEQHTPWCVCLHLLFWGVRVEILGVENQAIHYHPFILTLTHTHTLVAITAENAYFPPAFIQSLVPMQTMDTRTWRPHC